MPVGRGARQSRFQGDQGIDGFSGQLVSRSDNYGVGY